MFVLYTYEDMGQMSPNASDDVEYDWLNEVVLHGAYAREGISPATQKAVTAFDDGPDEGTCHHHVPYARIVRQLELNMTKTLTREECVTYLCKVLDKLGIQHPIAWQQSHNSRYAFDSWVSIAIDLVCDWPYNLFRGKAAGDGKGTTIDTPTDGSAKLDARLMKAQKMLVSTLLISAKPKESTGDYLGTATDVIPATGAHGYPLRSQK